MKNLKKILALVLCIITVMGTCSAFAISAQAVSGPAFTLEETAKNGNVVTYELKLKSGGFNALDFKFVTSEGVTCSSITVNSDFMGVANTQNGYVSLIYSVSPIAAYTNKTTVVTAKFTVPASNSYTVSGYVENCSVCSGTDNITVTGSTSVESGSQSIFARIIAVIVSLFRMIIDFLKSLFA